MTLLTGYGKVKRERAKGKIERNSGESGSEKRIREDYSKNQNAKSKMTKQKLKIRNPSSVFTTLRRDGPETNTKF